MMMVGFSRENRTEGHSGPLVRPLEGVQRRRDDDHPVAVIAAPLIVDGPGIVGKASIARLADRADLVFLHVSLSYVLVAFPWIWNSISNWRYSHGGLSDLDDAPHPDFFLRLGSLLTFTG